MFDFGNANREQKQAIQSVEGPIRIIAGPGTGKTYTLVQRIVYLVEECRVEPKNILVVTFTEKAAKELLTRISKTFSDKNIQVNICEMYIGTFHSICLKLLKELDVDRNSSSYQIMDSFEQQYLIYRNIGRFRAIKDFDFVICEETTWKKAGQIAEISNRLIEELIDIRVLKDDSNREFAAVGRIVEEYQNLLNENAKIDFSTILYRTYRLLTENANFLKCVQERFNYIMIDEYQDTNLIQERIVLLIGKEHRNICIVGDEDQSLYRFRGARATNIIDFPNFFNNECQTIKLTTNYRSKSSIVDFYNNWMNDTTIGGGKQFSWEQARCDKTIVSSFSDDGNQQRVCSLSGLNEKDEFIKLYNMIIGLKRCNIISDYNQIVFLFRSVKSGKAKKLFKYLEEKNIQVYSPRSELFFEREEVKLALGLLLLVLPQYSNTVLSEETLLSNKCEKYYKQCIDIAKTEIQKTNNLDLNKWVTDKATYHMSVSGTTDYTFLSLLYEMFQFEYFAKILQRPISNNVFETRSVRNLSILTQIISHFELLHGIKVLSDKYIEKDTKELFGFFINLLYEEGIDEYEDKIHYAPSGCVSFMTVHQAKGLEFPVVIVESLDKEPKRDEATIAGEIIDSYSRRHSIEKADYIIYYDYWRLFYTAFSRAQDMLVLSSNQKEKVFSAFKRVVKGLPVYNASELLSYTDVFSKIKETECYSSYSFSDLAMYQTCPQQYKFYGFLDFAVSKNGDRLFGSLVHDTLCDFHRSIIKSGEEPTMSEVEVMFEENYERLAKCEHVSLSENRLNYAFSQVKNYINNYPGIWKHALKAEEAYIMPQNGYLLMGVVDLITKMDNSLCVVDFKTSPIEDTVDEEMNARYISQLLMYSQMVERNENDKVSLMKLLYTSDLNGVFSKEYIPDQYDKATYWESLDDVVGKIKSNCYLGRASRTKTCSNCDFKAFCDSKHNRVI